MKPDLSLLELSIAAAAVEDLPALVGDLARLQSRAALRIASAGPPKAVETDSGASDQLISVKVVGKRLNRSASWVYRHKYHLPFYRSLPGGRGGFSEAGLNRYLRRR